MTHNLLISLSSIIVSEIALFVASKLKNHQFIHFFGLLVAFILFGVFLDFSARAVNESVKGHVSTLSMALLVGGSMYFACALSGAVRNT